MDQIINHLVKKENAAANTVLVRVMQKNMLIFSSNIVVS